MLELLIIGGIVFLVLKGGQLNIPGATAPVIQNATGASLSTVLGTSSAPPSNYTSGNPGYNAAPTPPPVIAGPSAVPSPMPVQFAQQSASPIVNPAFKGGTATTVHNNVLMARPIVTGARTQSAIVPPQQIRVFNPATQTVQTLNPAISQGPVNVARNSPEVASPFWTTNLRQRRVTTY